MPDMVSAAGMVVGCALLVYGLCYIGASAAAAAWYKAKRQFTKEIFDESHKEG